MGDRSRYISFTFKVFFLFSLHKTIVHCQDQYVIDADIALGRTFDGIGAISGGGATSKLLLNYPEPQRSQVLDYLFKPNFGASLHILKVEIGGDSQSSEGTESSHMHTADSESYHRGYEWWLMKEAKKRNPAIKLYGLPWGFPGWLADGDWWPFRYPNRTATYITKWILGAKKYHGLIIDYIGIWNEKPYDINYIKVLRQNLNSHGLHHVKIVAADLIGFDSWDIVEDIIKDPDFAKAVDIVGGHYTGTWTSNAAKKSGKALWSSEDYSSNNDETGGGCMARLVNQNYVNGQMTSTIAWNLIYSYYAALPYSPNGLMTANEPWSGHYEVKSPIWTTAHTTQFSQPGWVYLSHGRGVGTLSHGGTYVTMVTPDRKEATIVIETMDMEDGAFCLRLPQQKYKVSSQQVTLQLEGRHLGSIAAFHVWRSTLGLGKIPSVYFRYEGLFKVSNRSIYFHAEVNSVYTLTTLDSGRHGNFEENIPDKKPFPHPYYEDFENYSISSEPYNFAQQVGVFQVVQSGGRSRVLSQVVTQPPIYWCPLKQTIPLNVIGNYNWTDTMIQVDVFVPGSDNRTAGVFVAGRVTQGGCTAFLADGVFVFLHYDRAEVELTTNLEQTQSIHKAQHLFVYNQWYKVMLLIKGLDVTFFIDGSRIFAATLSNDTSKNGFTAIGTNDFGVGHFDNFAVDVR